MHQNYPLNNVIECLLDYMQMVCGWRHIPQALVTDIMQRYQQYLQSPFNVKYAVLYASKSVVGKRSA